MLRGIEALGRGTVRRFDEIGFATALFGESLFWTFAGWRWRQPVRLAATVAQMVEVGIQALPIATLLAATVGLMLAIQSLYSLGLFGAESFAHVGIALAVTREFSPLIIGILVAGRSGSALAARLSTMAINQEIDALKVIGIDPVRFLVAPALLAMLIMLPALTMWANIVALMVKAGSMISIASSAGATRKRTGSMPITLRASTSWLIAIVLSRAARAEPDRPATRMPMIKGENSRVTARAMPTWAKDSAPNRPSE